MESILTSIKKLLGIQEEYDHFDPDIIMCINTAFSTLTQLGVGPQNGFRIEDETSTWADFLGDEIKMESVKSYIHLKVKLLFDSSSLSSAYIESANRMANEIEWRLQLEAEQTKNAENDKPSENVVEVLSDINDALDTIITTQEAYIGGDN